MKQKNMICIIGVSCLLPFLLVVLVENEQRGKKWYKMREITWNQHHTTREYIQSQKL